MRALSIRQPWAELILRGIKTIEYRSRRTKMIGERFWIYASQGDGTKAWRQRATNEPAGIWSRDLAMATDGPPAWMWELAEALILSGEPLPRGMIVGSAIIERCEEVIGRERARSDGRKTVGGLSSAHDLPSPAGPPPSVFHWHLADVQRLDLPRKPSRHPQPGWFQPD